MGDYYPVGNINPIISSSGNSEMLVHIIFNGLLKPDERFNMIPDLANKWERSANGLEWKFYLKKGVKFHDGRELTSEDVKFTYDLIKNLEYRGYYTQFFEPIEQINIIDRYTIEILLNRPYAPLLSGLSVGILPKHIYTGGDMFDPGANKYPVGTGPFKVLSIAPDEIILEANRNYFDRHPYLDRIIFKIFKDQRTLFAKMFEGAIDTIIDVNPENIDILKQVSDFQSYKFLKPFYYILAFQNKGIFKSRRVRLALNYAINKKELLKKVLNEEGKIAAGPVYPLSWAYNKTITEYPYNPQKALDLLNLDGWRYSNRDHVLIKDGDKLEFTVLTETRSILKEKSLRQIQVDLNRTGIIVKTKKYPVNVFNSHLKKKEFDAIIITLVGRGDPDNSYKFWHSSQIERGRNFFSFKNDKIDEYLEKGREIFGLDLRKEFYYRFQEEIFNDPPGVFLFWANNFSVVHKRLNGIKMHPNWMYDLKNWYIPKEEQRQ